MDLCTVEDALPLYRYKYLPFNEGSLKIITEGTLKFTCPTDFNDPFDCSPSYYPESITNFLKTRPDLYKKVGAAQGLSPAKRLQKKGVYIQNLRNSVESGEWTKTLVAKLGILSLSRVATNILMWSHYAKDHTGFVVELSIGDAPLELLRRVVPHRVTYSESRPQFNMGEGVDLDGYFLTKSKDWSYEEEERVLNHEDGPGIHSYSRENFLCSVIAGSRISPENLELLRVAVAAASKEIGREIPLYQAVLARDKYQVHVPRHPRLDICQR